MTDKNIELATHHDVLPEPRCYAGDDIYCTPAEMEQLRKDGFLRDATPEEKRLNKQLDQTNPHRFDTGYAGDIAELEHENRLLRARNERLQALVNSIVPHLESWCGASAMPPKRMVEHIEQWGNV